MDTDQVWLTPQQVAKISELSEEYQLALCVESTNLTDTVLIKYRTVRTHSFLSELLVTGKGDTLQVS